MTQKTSAALDLEYIIENKNKKDKIEYLEDMQKEVSKLLASLKGYDHG
jgi:uncharacterized protein YfcZ (UPF0381/DUF406 family)